MGLRIIDRSIPENRRLQALESQFSYWAEKRASPLQETMSGMLAHYQSVRKRLSENDKIKTLAEVMHQRIQESAAQHRLPHKEIDIATVLELLQD